MTTQTRAAKVNPLIGRTFNATVADSQSLFRVASTKGRGVYVCIVDAGEYKGTTRLFATKELESILRVAAAFDAAYARSDDYYAKVKVGDTVHYHHGFGEYVRCLVVEGTDGQGQMLKPIALVGAWKDPVKRNPDGTLSESYMAQSIRKGAPWRPNAGCVFEAPEFTRQGVHTSVHPGTLAPINLNLPALTPEETAQVAKVAILRKIQALADQGQRDPEATLKAIQALLDAAGLQPDAG